LHARCLLTVVSQVPIINFWKHFMSISSIIISACSLWLHLPFQFDTGVVLDLVWTRVTCLEHNSVVIDLSPSLMQII
jgi:hypothetical protein